MLLREPELEPDDELRSLDEPLVDELRSLDEPLLDDDDEPLIFPDCWSFCEPLRGA